MAEYTVEKIINARQWQGNDGTTMQTYYVELSDDQKRYFEGPVKGKGIAIHRPANIIITEGEHLEGNLVEGENSQGPTLTLKKGSAPQQGQPKPFKAPQYQPQHHIDADPQRRSIERQVALKAATEIAVAKITQSPNPVTVEEVLSWAAEFDLFLAASAVPGSQWNGDKAPEPDAAAVGEDDIPF